MISIKRRSVGDIIANVVIYILLTLIAVIMVIPFIYVIAASFATEAEIQTRPIFFIPDSPTLDAYARIFDMNDMGKIYMMITVAIVPIIIVYLLLSKYIIAGVTLGGVKE